MRHCALCKELIVEDDLKGIGLTCDRCEIHYCEKCAFDIFTIKHCYQCGERMRVHSHSEDAINGENFHKTDKRRHPRDEYTTTIEYIIAQYIEKETPVKRIKAVTKDISKSGICIYTEQEHHPGQKLTFCECEGLQVPPDAKVIWSKKVNGSIYRVGLEFI